MAEKVQINLFSFKISSRDGVFSYESSSPCLDFMSHRGSDDCFFSLSLPQIYITPVFNHTGIFTKQGYSTRALIKSRLIILQGNTL